MELRLPSHILIFLASCAQAGFISSVPGSDYLQLGSQTGGPQIWVAANDWPAVTRVAGDLAVDFGRVLGVNGTAVVQNSTISYTSGEPVIIAGTIGNSSLIDRLVSKSKISVKEIEGQWESYIQQVVANPIAGISKALVIAGSDRRGTVFGMYDISEAIGVSPWYWWADVPPKAKSAIYAAPTRNVVGEPSIKYRGIFINDETICLQAWAAERFTSSKYGSPFTAEFYEQVFELLLRLRANYLWPAMKKSMFYIDDITNGQMADEYGIVMGTSHTEPLARATNEQSKFLSGSWDWESNSANIKEFMTAGVQRSSKWETLYTMGMRGSGDTASPTLTAQQLEEIIDFQQSALQSQLGRSVDQVPQMWSLYKEVGSYWQAGMNVSEDVTLMWTDDNFGNLLRVPYPNETSRAGGAGVYYHFSYVGEPREYEWINTIQLVKTWEQMFTAYVRQARKIWIVNVGDIKPYEIPISHFLDMAYNMTNHLTPSSASTWINSWARKQFGSSVAHATEYIMNRYGMLVMRRKFEGLNLSPFVYSTINYDEGWKVLEDWEDLLALAQSVYDSLDSRTQPSYYQMVLHPVLAGKTVEELYVKTQYSKAYQLQRRTSTNIIAQQAVAAFNADANISRTYNSMESGRWNHFMDQPHIEYKTWYTPGKNSMPTVSYIANSTAPRSGIMGVSIQGSNQTSPGDSDLVLLSMDPYMPPSETRYVDISCRDNGTFSYVVESNVSYVSIANAEGTLKSPGSAADVRCVISVDWDAAPSGLSWVALHINNTAEKSLNTTAYLPINKTLIPSRFSGYIESNGAVSIEAAHYSQAETKKGMSYIELPYYGRTLSGIKLWPINISSQTTSTAPKLTYRFYSFGGSTGTSTAANLTLYLGGSRNYDPMRPMRYAYSLDSAAPSIVQPIPNSGMGTDPDGWNASVITSGWNTSSPIDVARGPHKLDIWLLEPGLVLQKLVIDLGGVRSSGLGPPESKKL